MKRLESIPLLGVPITTRSKDDILEYIAQSIEEPHCKLFIATPNPEILVYAQHHPKFKSILKTASLALPDGIGIIIAARILNLPLFKRITGVDFVESLCETLSKKNVSVGFLGGRPGVAGKTAECLASQYPGLQVVFASEEWNIRGFEFGSKYPAKEKKEILPNTKYKIPHTNVDVLFVAFGAPHQEEWITQNIDRLPIKVAMGVGGTFDYISGKVGRAPRWVQRLGAEWLYRLIRQPWRIKRQIALIEFIGMILKERIRTSR